MLQKLVFHSWKLTFYSYSKCPSLYSVALLGLNYFKTGKFQICFFFFESERAYWNLSNTDRFTTEIASIGCIFRPFRCLFMLFDFVENRIEKLANTKFLP